jgi:hypothetical protein
VVFLVEPDEPSEELLVDDPSDLGELVDELSEDELSEDELDEPADAAAGVPLSEGALPRLSVR